jgi:hypothetical protein
MSLKNLFRKSPASVKIDSQTAQVLELEATKQRLVMEKEQIDLELRNLKSKQQMSLEEETHKHKLRLQEEKAIFDREKKVWEVERKELIDRSKREIAEFEERLKKDTEIKLQEAVTLTKLESQQQIKQAELDRDREINTLKVKTVEEISKVRTELAEEYYNKLTAAFQEIQLKGDANSKFVQDLALKMFDKVPSTKSRVEVDVNSNVRELTGTSN